MYTATSLWTIYPPSYLLSLCISIQPLAFAISQDLPSKEGSPAANGTHTSAPAAPAARPPACIHDSPGLRVWHRALGPVRLPKAAAYFSLAGRHLYDSPEAAAAAVLLIKLVKDALNEQAYLADIAGLQYGVSPPASAVHLSMLSMVASCADQICVRLPA